MRSSRVENGVALTGGTLAAGLSSARAAALRVLAGLAAIDALRADCFSSLSAMLFQWDSDVEFVRKKRLESRLTDSVENIQIVTDYVTVIWVLNRYHVIWVALPDVADTQVDIPLEAELSVK